MPTGRGNVRKKKKKKTSWWVNVTFLVLVTDGLIMLRWMSFSIGQCLITSVESLGADCLAAPLFFLQLQVAYCCVFKRLADIRRYIYTGHIQYTAKSIPLPIQTIRI